jgi:alpha-ketoglutarate-dependent taurine dioxygenase
LDQVLTQIDHPSAWNAADMARPEDWQATLPCAVLAELLDEAAGIDTTDNASITRHAVEPARLPKAAAFMAGIEHDVMAGRGFVLLRGLDPALPDATMKAAYWVMGQLMGTPVSQNVHGETLTDVRDYGKQMHAKQVRSYETNANLKLHTDRAELVGLLCLQRARAGGLSSIASSIAVYNAMLAEHPDLLEPLFTGPHCVRNEADGKNFFYRMPVLSIEGGALSCRYSRNNLDTAMRYGAPYTQAEKDAIDRFDAYASDPRFRLDMMLERGEIQLINSFTTLHARTEFDDYPEPQRRRCMVRFWLTTHTRRPLAAHFADYSGITADFVPPIPALAS